MPENASICHFEILTKKKKRKKKYMQGTFFFFLKEENRQKNSNLTQMFYNVLSTIAVNISMVTHFFHE